jgi:hypothetical protein
MWLLAVIVILTVVIGLAWAYYNFQQIKKIPIGSNFSVD